MSFVLLDVVEWGLWIVMIAMIPLGAHVGYLLRAELRREREAKMVDYSDSKWWP